MTFRFNHLECLPSLSAISMVDPSFSTNAFFAKGPYRWPGSKYQTLLTSTASVSAYNRELGTRTEPHLQEWPGARRVRTLYLYLQPSTPFSACSGS